MPLEPEKREIRTHKDTYQALWGTTFTLGKDEDGPAVTRSSYSDDFQAYEGAQRVKPIAAHNYSTSSGMCIMILW